MWRMKNLVNRGENMDKIFSINRKDVIPEETFKKIETILRENNIELQIEKVKSITNKWFSCRVEYNGIIYVGANGKGITEEFSKASAYGEFMERLQGMYMVELFSKNNSLLDNEDILNFIRNIKKTDVTDNEIIEFLNNNKQARIGMEYYNVFEKKVEKLPEWFIEKFSMSSGLCAGNTQEEALSQGICEIFERYIKMMIFTDKIKVPTINKEDFKGSYSYEMINIIEEKGYHCLIKDCTLAGRFPVLGLIILNDKKDRMIFALGSDLDIDICLQRCITEIFQGRDLDDEFAKNLTRIGFNVVFQGNNVDEYVINNTLYNNQGPCPIQLISFTEDTDKKYKNAFLNEKSSNKEVFKTLLDIMKKNNLEVYFRDHSYLNFNCYRVYVKNISETRYLSTIIKCAEKGNAIRNSILNFDTLSTEDMLILCKNICEYQKCIHFDSKRSILRAIPELSGVDMFDDYLFLSMIYGYLSYYDYSLKYLLKYLNKNEYDLNSQKYLEILVYLMGKFKRIDDDELKDICSNFKDDDNDYKKIIIDKNKDVIMSKIPKIDDRNNSKQLKKLEYFYLNYSQNNMIDSLRDIDS